ncbi:MAG: hypothetical protein OEQ13_06495, partial [Acidobacteriota bacterium]|nr:hypothetical protein [Acidobacteriota bacterium]
MTRAPREQQGRGTVGLLAGLAALSLLLSAAASLQGSHRRRAVESASFGLAEKMRGLAVEARSDGLSRALVFPETSGDEPLRVASDVAGDGITREGISGGADRSGRPFSLSIDQPGVRIGRLARDGLPDLPPSRRRL